MSKGPEDCKSLPNTFTSTSCATTPGISLILGSLMLNVNKDGTGFTMECPNVSKIFQNFTLLPVAIKSFSEANSWSCV